MVYLYIFIGGGLGSLARYIITKISSELILTDFPLGTYLSNILACLLLAILIVGISARHPQYAWVQPLLIIGFCGGFSTFSTFSNETFNLLDNGYTLLAITNILISVFVGIALIFFIRSRV